ncbi:MAG TPA: hypothetical protein VJV05_08790 [Pyrinomonadaceae bacterium]|nr:hypothetical protein [Pyrinomonadaceae bacterium]
MKRIVACCLLLLGVVVSMQAQVPSFSRYSAKVEKVTARAIDFKHSPGASGFRTRLTAALRGGRVTFAGRFILTGWGCGTGCVSAAIIDARTGRVYFPEPIGGVAVGDDENGDYYEKPIDFRKNSRLVIVRGTPGTQIDRETYPSSGDYYYEWKNYKLRPVLAVIEEKKEN